ncbi:MAG: ribosome silencing factor [Acidimicrobiia bacterium]|nr:ribosome silencing factor [Acidimicrobiia bacterium]MBJ7514292.1 ribosome silencing factor [Acidimicrobiia bacterium]
MTTNPKDATRESHVRAIVAAVAASEKKGTDILVLDVGAIIGITEAFVIASASNPRLVRAIVDEIEEKIRLHDGTSPLRTEGLDDLGWVLMDYGDFVAHIFLDEVRDFYALERLWSDASQLWSEPVVAPAVPVA